MSDDALTAAERHCLDLTRDLVNAFFTLSEHHPSDCVEFAHEIHAIQHRIMARAAIRAYPDRFTALEERT